jgi:cobalamin-dependent methionine synthase I
MVKALADRFAEARRIFARKIGNFGLLPDEVLTAEGMIAEEYKGIRPSWLSRLS